MTGDLDLVCLRAFRVADAAPDPGAHAAGRAALLERIEAAERAALLAGRAPRRRTTLAAAVRCRCRALAGAFGLANLGPAALAAPGESHEHFNAQAAVLLAERETVDGRVGCDAAYHESGVVGSMHMRP